MARCFHAAKLCSVSDLQIRSQSQSKPPPAVLIPASSLAQVWLDFDGTISRADVLDALIRKFAVNDSWKIAEQSWQDGAIGSRACLETQFAAVRVPTDEMLPFLDSIDIDPGVFPLLSLLAEHAVPVAILSDGIELFIRRLLERNGIVDIAIRSNSISCSDDRLTLRCPHHVATCESAAAHCKCASTIALGQPGRKSIYVGDGRSDLCPARKSDVVFAKASLAAALDRERKAFLPFDSLEDVAAHLSRAWSREFAIGSARRR